MHRQRNNTVVHRKSLIAAAARSNVPKIYPFRFMATDGGLISYGVDLIDLYRRAAPYVDRILKGGVPADLPVQQPTKLARAILCRTSAIDGVAVSDRTARTDQCRHARSTDSTSCTSICTNAPPPAGGTDMVWERTLQKRERLAHLAGQRL